MIETTGLGLLMLAVVGVSFLAGVAWLIWLGVREEELTPSSLAPGLLGLAALSVVALGAGLGLYL